MKPAFRLAETKEDANIMEVEYEASELFLAYDELSVLYDPICPSRVTVIEEGRVIVACISESDDEKIVGFVHFSVLEGDPSGDCIFIDEIDVLPSFGRKGIGSGLVQEVEKIGRDRDCTSIALTTFATIPWNGPWYSRLGFEEVPPEQWTENLRNAWNRDMEAGLGRFPNYPRILMQKSLSKPQ
jgi:GNAT superfamily N-acetyltransferase